jgi:hypothetical protein
MDRTRRTPTVVVVTLVLVAACAHLIATNRLQASAGTYPAVAAYRGPAIAVAEYDLGDTAFTDPPDWTAASELKAVVHYPRKLWSGKLPLIMQLHGQAYTCATEADHDWPCPPGVTAIPSYRGYDYLGEALAQRGFVVVSLSANGINTGMGTAAQRAHLINRHLAMWEQLSATGRGPLAGRFTDPATGTAVPVEFQGRVDMQRVGTMGHSVGGLGVMRQAADRFRGEWPRGVRIRAVAPIASVYFNENENDNSDTLVTRISLAVLSAQCWGDGDHQYFEDTRGINRVPVYLMTLNGANHSFLNTVWSPESGEFGTSDDSDCPADPAKLSESTERKAAVAYLTAYYERTLKGAEQFDPILTGAKPLGVAGVTGTATFMPAAG